MGRPHQIDSSQRLIHCLLQHLIDLRRLETRVLTFQMMQQVAQQTPDSQRRVALVVETAVQHGSPGSTESWPASPPISTGFFATSEAAAEWLDVEIDQRRFSTTYNSESSRPKQ